MREPTEIRDEDGKLVAICYVEGLSEVGRANLARRIKDLQERFSAGVAGQQAFLLAKGEGGEIANGQDALP